MPRTAARLCFLALLLVAAKASLAAVQNLPGASAATTTAKKLSFGNLRKLSLKGGNGRYTLNGVELPRIDTKSICLRTLNQSYKVRATFLKTVLISRGRPISSGDKTQVRDWAQSVPLVAEILKKQDSIGSLKPVVYDLIEPRYRTDLRLQEELVFLWSADPSERSTIGNTTLMPPMPFPGRLIDVQYRGLKGSTDQLIGKIILQILYVKDHDKPSMLGAFVIVSKPSGDFEFYLLPRSLLDQIVIISGETPRKSR